MLKQVKQHAGRSLALTILAAATLYSVVPNARAADSALPEIKSFAELDINQDGFIDKKEASIFSALTRVFDSSDADKNGHLSPPEYAKAFSPKP